LHVTRVANAQPGTVHMRNRLLRRTIRNFDRPAAIRALRGKPCGFSRDSPSRV
jgi:hypothetical protein